MRRLDAAGWRPRGHRRHGSRGGERNGPRDARRSSEPRPPSTDVLSRAKVSLRDATSRAVRANAGYRAVSVFPVINDGSPMADVALMKAPSGTW